MTPRSVSLQTEPHQDAVTSTEASRLYRDAQRKHPHTRNSPVPAAPRASLSLVPRPTRHRATKSLLALWHLLSLDAPSVATLWTFAVARACGLHLPWTSAAAIFVAVWMLYAADRLLDARVLDRPHATPNATPRAPHDLPPDLEARHLFHHRHRRAFLLGIVLSACALAALLRTLDPRALRLYSLLATLLAVWLLLIHARPDSAHRLPKELAVGIFFPAAVFIPTVARNPQLRLDLLPVAALLAALCSLNCLFLYAWEHPHNRSHAHWSTRWATRRLIPLTLTVAALSLIAATLATRSAPAALHRNSAALLLCILASSLLLLLLHQLRRRIEPTHLRALADLVLLTPLLLLLHA